MNVGFVGQGYIGKNMADDFTDRGFEVVRYALEAEYVGNKDAISTCDMVFIAVPTPTTPAGFDARIVEESLSLVKDGASAVIKSTVLPGTTRALQKKYPNLHLFFSPEFLSKATARKDTRNPMITVIGCADDTEETKKRAGTIVDVLPRTEHTHIVAAETAEMFKYIHNIHGFVRVVLSNLFYDLGESVGASWSDLKAMISADPMMSPYYNDPVHQSGRGAGGCCFIKDFAAFRSFYESKLSADNLGISLLRALEHKNLDLLTTTDKNRNYIEEVYGPSGVRET